MTISEEDVFSMSNVQSKGTETSLFSCKHDMFGSCNAKPGVTFTCLGKLYLCTCLVVGFSRMLKDYMSRGLAEAPRYCSDTRGDKGEGIKRRI